MGLKLRKTAACSGGGDLCGVVLLWRCSCCCLSIEENQKLE